MEFEYLKRNVEEFFGAPFKIHRLPKETPELTTALSAGFNIPAIGQPVTTFLDQMAKIPKIQGIGVVLETLTEGGRKFNFGEMHWHFILSETPHPNTPEALDLEECITNGVNSIQNILELILQPSMPGILGLL